MHKAINAKFKKGDKVVSSDGKYHGVVWGVYGDGEIAVKCEEDDPLTRRRFDQNRLKLANCSTANSVVAKAVANARAANSSAEPTVAKNGAADVLVSFTTITAKGLEKVQARMTESDFDVWAKKVGAGDTQNVWAQLMQSGKAGFAITRPLSVTVTQL